MNFKISLMISTEKVVGILIAILLDLYQYRSIAMLIILSLSVLGHEISFHLVKCLISFKILCTCKCLSVALSWLNYFCVFYSFGVVFWIKLFSSFHFKIFHYWYIEMQLNFQSCILFFFCTCLLAIIILLSIL